MRKSFTPLPKYIHFSSPDVMIAASAWLAAYLGLELIENVKIETWAGDPSSATILEFWGGDSFNVRVYTQSEHDGSRGAVSYYNNSSMSNISPEQCWHIKSVRELMNKVCGPIYTVGDYHVVIKEDGIQFGCTHVDWDMVRKIASHAPPAPPETPGEPVKDDMAF